MGVEFVGCSQKIFVSHSKDQLGKLEETVVQETLPPENY